MVTFTQALPGYITLQKHSLGYEKRPMLKTALGFSGSYLSSGNWHQTTGVFQKHQRETSCSFLFLCFVWHPIFSCFFFRNSWDLEYFPPLIYHKRPTHANVIMWSAIPSWFHRFHTSKILQGGIGGFWSEKIQPLQEGSQHKWRWVEFLTSASHSWRTWFGWLFGVILQPFQPGRKWREQNDPPQS